MKHLFESESFNDEPPLKSGIKDTFSDEVVYDDLDHIYTANQIENYELVYEWRQICEEISKRTNRVRAMIVEATYDVEDIGCYYWYKNKPNAHFAINFQLCFLNELLFKRSESTTVVTDGKKKFKKSVNPTYIQLLLDEYFQYVPSDGWRNWGVRRLLF